MHRVSFLILRKIFVNLNKTMKINLFSFSAVFTLRLLYLKYFSSLTLKEIEHRCVRFTHRFVKSVEMAIYTFKNTPIFFSVVSNVSFL